MKRKIVGVYMVKCNITKRIRVGSSRDILNRFAMYKCNLRQGKGNPVMQKDFNEYGIGEFEFIILEKCKVKELFEREKYYLKLYEDCCIYNANKIANTRKKIRRGVEARKLKEKLSKAKTGEKNGNSILTNKDVMEILKLRNFYNYDIAAMAEKFKVSKSQIYKILKGKAFKNVYEKFLNDYKKALKITNSISKVNIDIKELNKIKNDVDAEIAIEFLEFLKIKLEKELRKVLNR